MSFHQKGALKKHSTQTLEQVRTVVLFPHVVCFFLGGGGGRGGHMQVYIKPSEAYPLILHL